MLQSLSSVIKFFWNVYIGIWIVFQCWCYRFQQSSSRYLIFCCICVCVSNRSFLPRMPTMLFQSCRRVDMKLLVLTGQLIRSMLGECSLYFLLFSAFSKLLFCIKQYFILSVFVLSVLHLSVTWNIHFWTRACILYLFVLYLYLYYI